jgi:hypothetical protein
MPQKSRKRSVTREKNTVIVTEDAIIITLTEKQKKKVRQSIRKSGIAKFKIKEIQVKCIPSVQPGDKPVQGP